MSTLINVTIGDQRLLQQSKTRAAANQQALDDRTATKQTEATATEQVTAQQEERPGAIPNNLQARRFSAQRDKQQKLKYKLWGLSDFNFTPQTDTVSTIFPALSLVAGSSTIPFYPANTSLKLTKTLPSDKLQVNSIYTSYIGGVPSGSLRELVSANENKVYLSIFAARITASGFTTFYGLYWVYNLNTGTATSRATQLRKYLGPGAAINSDYLNALTDFFYNINPDDVYYRRFSNVAAAYGGINNLTYVMYLEVPNIILDVKPTLNYDPLTRMATLVSGYGYPSYSTTQLFTYEKPSLDNYNYPSSSIFPSGYRSPTRDQPGSYNSAFLQQMRDKGWKLQQDVTSVNRGNIYYFFGVPYKE